MLVSHIIQPEIYFTRIDPNNSPELLNLSFEHIFHKNDPANAKTMPKLFLSIPVLRNQSEAARGLVSVLCSDARDLHFPVNPSLERGGCLLRVQVSRRLAMVSVPVEVMVQPKHV